MIDVYNSTSFFNKMYHFLLRQLDTLIYVLIGPFAILYVFPQFWLQIERKANIHIETSLAMDYIGTLFMWAGAILAIYCATYLLVTKNSISPFSSQTQILTKGPFKMVRHPMMWSIHIVLIGEMIVYSSPILIIWFLLWLRLATIYVSRFEEPALIKHFGSFYLEYCKVTPRWLPKL